ncbi:FUSC family membrane protein [Hymenobacter psychrotolerans]|uniref:TIGR01666 family membrane protein n=1 Tax=Hymenobacter psychrotolerans DSM 18569 TaxID=1121959 RepID=A0A1M6RLL1_9BACT|nr:FUSC family membrane protein [Hymenobacter psychrotolerans]SHK33345.1 TIGR01666 family membrane protein [Hymenobacter psychrotolerans DSM 18569]
MNAHARKFRYFFFSQDFSDALRITLAVLVPGVLLGWLGHLAMGMEVALGALCVSIADGPGPLLHKRNGMLATVALLPVLSMLTGLVQPHLWLLGLEIGVLSFVFTLFLVYGNRAASVGTAGLLLVILMMDRTLTLRQLIEYTLQVTAGGVWYMLVSLLWHQIRPYRPAQQALGECIRAIAGFLRLKAEFYRTGTSLEEDYRRLMAQQVTVSEKQDAVRELLFKTRQMMKESTGTGRRLVLTFVDVVDLYEHITVVYYDYAALHARFEATGVLDTIAGLVEQLAAELERVGFAVEANHGYTSRVNLTESLEQLKLRIDALDDPAQPGHTWVLKKILVNLRNLTQRLQDVQAYFDASAPAVSSRELEFGRFVAHQSFGLEQLRDHLTLNSGMFRHAVRMMLACLAGFVVAKVVLPGHHSYWIIMTITYMLKPAFSLTKQRNIHRVLGTLVGGGIGVLVLWLVPDHRVLVVLLALFMLTSFSFTRSNYIVAVTFMTPFVLILFSFLGLGYLEVVEERVLDTVLGCLLAFAASYLLFPRWESDQLHDHMKAVLRANLRYLQTLQESLTGSPVAVVDYKLARKEVYVSSANLAAAFQRMMSEPRGKQHRPTEVHEFVVLNHILSSNVASITSGLLAGPGRPEQPGPLLRPVRQAQQALHRSLRRLDPAEPEAAAETATTSRRPDPVPPDPQLTEQLDFIQKVSSDISKVTEEVLTGPALLKSH